MASDAVEHATLVHPASSAISIVRANAHRSPSMSVHNAHSARPAVVMASAVFVTMTADNGLLRVRVAGTAALRYLHHQTNR